MASSPIPSRDLREVYAKPFQAAISVSDVASIMNSYGSVNGELVTTSKHILTDLLRGELGFEGVVVSDYMSIQHVPQHRLSENMEEAAIMAVKAGLDVECPFPASYGSLIQSVLTGALDEEYINVAVKRVLACKFKLGLFENPFPREEKFEETYYDPKGVAHSLKASLESVVLLKNNGILPLSKDIKKIAVIGPHGNSLRLMFGCYTYPAALEMDIGRAKGEMAGMGGANQQLGQQEADEFVQAEMMPGSEVIREHTLVSDALEEILRGKTPTIVEALQKRFPKVELRYVQGCEIAGNDKSDFSDALEAAKNADVVIFTAGGKYGWGRNCTVGEGIDTDHLNLPGVQEELAIELHKTGTPCILAHFNARPLSSEYVAENYAAVLECWFPGTTGGEALATILSGDYNPAGRLPVTIARNTGQIPIHIGQKIGNSHYTDGMNMVLARYIDSVKKPLYYFGEGLSYTSFEYSNLSINASDGDEETFDISVDIKNTGLLDGDEVAQLYIIDNLASMVRPALEYSGGKRVFLRKGEKKTVRFTVRSSQFAFINKENHWIVEAGEMGVKVGAASNDIRLEDKFTIKQTKLIDSKERGFYAKTEVF